MICKDTWLIWKKNVLEEKLQQLGLEHGDPGPYEVDKGELLDNQIPGSVLSSLVSSGSTTHQLCSDFFSS